MPPRFAEIRTFAGLFRCADVCFQCRSGLYCPRNQRRVRHEKNLVSVHVEQLVQGGYLLRESVDGDRRKIGLRCTERAQPIVREGIRIYTELFEGITKGLSKQEIEQCYQSLLTIEVNADRML